MFGVETTASLASTFPDFVGTELRRTLVKHIKPFVALILAAAASASGAELPQRAFPTAEGFGAYSRGGRGGKVLFVTNLNDAGPGSFREACMTQGPRTVLFRVSGRIDLKSRLVIREPFLTIAGQSAPGEGICLSGMDFIVSTNNVIIRYLRSRPGDKMPGERDAFSLTGVDNVIVDHCSASWGIDEQLSTWRSKTVTVQWCLITEALHNSHHSKGNHGFGSLIQCEGATYHHNLYAHNRSRNPRPGSGTVDFRNNVIYDWNGMAGYAEDNKHRVNYVGNYLKPGPSTVDSRNIGFHTGMKDTYYFVQGNVFEGLVAEGEEDDRIFRVRNGGNLVDQPVEAPAVRTDTATAAFERVLADAGATLPKRDSVDARIVEQVRSGGGRLIDSQDQVGGWPELRSEPAAADADNDGMPDAWEAPRGLNPSDPADTNADGDGDGYTNLEEFLNGTDPKSRD
jgi:pectate lyase